MFPDRAHPRGRRQRGLSLVAAVAVMLVLSVVAAFTMRTASTQQHASANDALGVRAYLAARSGLEWAAYQVMKGDLATGYCNGGATADTVSGLAGELAGFSVAVACERTSHVEAGSTVRMYAVTATACNRSTCPAGAAQANYVERQLTMVIAR